jgi:hypothetical protein
VSTQSSSTPNTSATERYLIVPQAAALLSVHPSTVRRWIDRGLLLAVAVITLVLLTGSRNIGQAADAPPVGDAPCRLPQIHYYTSCYLPTDLSAVQQKVNGRPVDPSDSILREAILPLSQLVLTWCSGVHLDLSTCNPPRAQGISHIFGTLEGAIPTDARAAPPFVLVGEQRGHLKLKGIRIDRSSGVSTTRVGTAQPVTKLEHGPWILGANLPHRHMYFSVVSNERRAVVRAIGLDIIREASTGA